MKIALLFATHNGEDTLERCLDSLAGVSTPHGTSLEIIAVDNGSTDSTRSILERYRRIIPLRIESEPKRGKNSALNSGIRRIDSDFVILTDDDVLFPAEFVQQWHETLTRHPEFEIYGGLVDPLYPSEEGPRWLTSDLPEFIETVCYARTPSTTHTGEVFPGLIFGNNMVVRRDFLEKVKFNEDIGPGSGNYGMGSETEYLRRSATVHGARAWFDRTIVVRHIIHPSQLDRRWILARAEKFGRGQAMMQDASQSSYQKQLWSAPRYLYRAAVTYLLRSLTSLEPARRLSAAWEFHEVKGRISGWRSRR